VVVGASLGGVDALRLLLSQLPEGFPAAVAVVQHRGSEGDQALANVLGRASALPVREAGDGDPIESGVVYVAPAGYHLLAERGVLRLSVEGPVSWARPSIDVLFQSAAEAYGRRVAAVLLTCSSEDGAAGIAAVHERGGLTIVEDPASAVSPVAAELALARTRVHQVLPLAQIARALQGVMVTGEG
jgi:two-component system chemotaxis response regulator CheB